MRTLSAAVLGYAIWLVSVGVTGAIMKIAIGLPIAWVLNGGLGEGSFDPSLVSTLVGLVGAFGIIEICGLNSAIEDCVFATVPPNRS